MGLTLIRIQVQILGFIFSETIEFYNEKIGPSQ